MLNTDSKQESN